MNDLFYVDNMTYLNGKEEQEKEYETMKSIIEELKALAEKENHTIDELLHPARKLSDLPFDPIKVHESGPSDVVMKLVKDRIKTDEKLNVLPEFLNLENESCEGFKEGVLYRWNKMTCRYEQYNPKTEKFEPINKENE
jgi:hypothetical protein